MTMERYSLRSKRMFCHKKEQETKELKKHNSTIEILNDDCLLHVFEYLPISDRIRLERVNKRWNIISRMSWRTFKTMKFTSKFWGHGVIINTKVLTSILNLCGEFLKVWDMSRISVLMGEKIHMQSAFKLCPNLTTVNLTSIIVGIHLVTALGKYCTHIVAVSLRELTYRSFGWFVRGEILSTFKNLQVLNIEVMSTTEYEKDIFQGDWITSSNKNSIRELRLEYCYGLQSSKIFRDISQFPNLHTLSLRASLIHWSVRENINYITQSNIKILDISNNSSCVNDHFIEKIACVCERLTSLYIGHNSLVTDKGLSALVSSTNLEFLNIDGLNIMGYSLSYIPSLKALSCRYCKHLEPKYFKHSFDTLDRLESIDLKGAEHIGDIIRQAMKSVQSRNADSALVIYVDKVIDIDIADMPDNLRLVRVHQDDDDDDDLPARLLRQREEGGAPLRDIRLHASFDPSPWRDLFFMHMRMNGYPSRGLL